MRIKRQWYLNLSASLAVLGVVLLMTRLGGRQAQAGAGEPGRAWPLTADGRSRFAGWSPDGRTVLVNRWGAVVGNGATRQVLSELWMVDVRGGPATRLSENAVQPVYAEDGQRLAYLAFAGDGRWEVRVLDVGSGQEEAWADVDWRTSLADFPVLPAGARARLSGVEESAVWGDDAHLWALPHPGGGRAGAALCLVARWTTVRLRPRRRCPLARVVGGRWYR